VNNHPAISLLLIVGLLQFWLMPAIAWTLLKGQRDTAAKFWFAGTACYAGTVTLFALQTALPHPINTFLGFGLIVLMLVFLAESLRRDLYTQPTPWGWMLSTIGVSLAIFGYAASVASSEMARVVQLCIVCLLDVVIVWLLIRVMKRTHSRALIFVLLAFAAVILTNLARIVAFLAHAQSPMLLTFSVTSNIGFIANYLSVVMYSFGYWGFVIEKNRSALLSEIKQRTEAQINERQASRRESVMRTLLTERDKLIERLAQVQQAAQASALSASIAHEINQPLTAIQLSIDEAIDLYRSGNAPDRLEILLARVVEENQRAAQIIRRLQDFFRGKTPEPETRLLDDMIKELCAAIQPTVDASRACMELDLAANVAVRLGAGDLDHVILNLISNSLNAFSRGYTKDPQIRIKTSLAGSRITLEVSDNGSGIAEGDRDSVFDLYAGANSAGMGLGLWLSKHILERSGGSIQLASGSSTLGARFVVQLQSR
jgi:C4-dicarboxylate-specific signal transduction histidine kinase